MSIISAVFIRWKWTFLRVSPLFPTDEHWLQWRKQLAREISICARMLDWILSNRREKEKETRFGCGWRCSDDQTQCRIDKRFIPDDIWRYIWYRKKNKWQQRKKPMFIHRRFSRCPSNSSFEVKKIRQIEGGLDWSILKFRGIENLTLVFVSCISWSIPVRRHFHWIQFSKKSKDIVIFSDVITSIH